MNLNKLSEVFDPRSIKGRVNIIGCGSVGSTIAELLARYGLTKFTLWDMDFVESKNIVNQMFFARDIGKPKVEAVRDIICAINPDAKDDIILKPDGWNGELVNGYVFLVVDNIDVRKVFVEKNKYNPNLLGVFDCRTGLYDAQCRSANWRNRKHIECLMRSMEFTHDEAMADVPVSACGIVQGVAPTVRMISCLAVTNFINFATGKGIKKMIVANPFNLDAEMVVIAN